MNDNINEKVKLVIKQAVQEGINVEIVGNYLKLVNIPVGDHKEIMDRLYQENSVYPWDLAFFREIDILIENLDKEDITIVNEIENNENTALLPVEQDNIFTKLGTLFSNIWNSIKSYVKEMQVEEINEETVTAVQENVTLEMSEVA